MKDKTVQQFNRGTSQKTPTWRKGRTNSLSYREDCSRSEIVENCVEVLGYFSLNIPILHALETQSSV